MQKIIIDTNVLISGIIQNGYPNLIIHNSLLSDKIEIAISEKLFSEYYQVLHRPKFSKYPDFLNWAEILLAQLKKRSVVYCPKNKIELITDINDNMILELAEECSANFIITGNTKDFFLKQFQKTIITTPKEYWENHRTI